MPKSKINIPLLTQYFADSSDRAFSLSNLESLFVDKAQEWNLPRSMTHQSFVQMLLSRTKLRELRVASPSYSSLLRYGWGEDISPISVAISIKDDAFFSHGSAMWIHGLGQDEKNIFINSEQSEKPRNSGRLTQEAIHRAFQNQQRRSKRIYKYQRTTITVLNGKHTGRMDVGPSTSPSGHKVEVTSLERTLIDITVRPGYSGDLRAVLQAFRLAKNRISVHKLITLLDKLDYTYPYHQSIGFYLKHAGYSDADQLLAKRDGLKFDFYLCHGLKDPAFDLDWSGDPQRPQRIDLTQHSTARQFLDNSIIKMPVT